MGVSQMFFTRQQYTLVSLAKELLSAGFDRACCLQAFPG